MKKSQRRESLALFLSGEHLATLTVIKANQITEMKMKKILLFAIAILILAACSSTPKVDLAGEWKLISYGDVANPTPAVPGVETTIKFENGKVGGNLGCNSFGGGYETKGNTIVFGSMFSTEMYCDATSTQEQAVFGIFADGVDLSIQMNGNILTITSPDGSSVINLARK